jgi:hypothetical protein
MTFHTSKEIKPAVRKFLRAGGPVGLEPTPGARDEKRTILPTREPNCHDAANSARRPEHTFAQPDFPRRNFLAAEIF